MVIDAACAAVGAHRVHHPTEMADLLVALRVPRRMAGRRAAILTDGGGHGAVAADALGAAGLQIPVLTGPVTVIGRGGDADIILEDTGVSRHHLELRAEADSTLIATDLGSTNGTFVDGERIRTPVALQDRSLLKIGRTRLTVQLPAAGPVSW